MAGWSVSESESEGEAMQDGLLDFGGVKLNQSRLVGLFRSMEEQRTLEFTCLSAAGEKEPRTRRERRRKRRKKRIVQSPGSGSKAEEVSETASELRSSASTTELRDGKRPDLSMFDYFHEDLSALTGCSLARRPASGPKRKKAQVSFDGIMKKMKAEELIARQSRTDKEAMEEEGEEERTELERRARDRRDGGAGGEHDSLLRRQGNASGNASCAIGSASASGENSRKTVVQLVSPMSPLHQEHQQQCHHHLQHHLQHQHHQQQKLNSNLFSFSDESDTEVSMSETASVFKQINKVEQLLDAEGFI